MEHLSPLIATVFLASNFVLGGRLQFGVKAHRRRWLSLGAGIATAYVFVHLLPELSRVQDIFAKATAGRGLPFPESRVYTSALAGFILMYGMEHLVSISRKRAEEGDGAAKEERNFVARVHMGGFFLYCALVSYTMSRESERGIHFLIFYLVAMSLHFLGSDHALRREYGGWYDNRGKWILAGGVLAGWCVALLSPLSIEVLATLMGFVGGGVVMNSLIAELPKEKEGRFWPFCAGAAAYAVLLLLLL
jgi:hypothetical protein